MKSRKKTGRPRLKIPAEPKRQAGPNLTTPELAERWGFNPSTLAQWRCRNYGPSYVRIGSKILYRLVDVEAYERQHREAI